MATHHPMDRLHRHLDTAAGHAAQVDAAAAKTLAESEPARPDDSPDTVRETLTDGGR